MAEPFDFQQLVVVAHEADHDLLMLQAKSIARYLQSGWVSHIWIVENFTPGVDPHWRDGLRRLYGPHADKVHFLRGSDLVDLSSTGAGGWWTQQVLKLKVAEAIGGRTYTVLDAKNHLVAPLDHGFLRAPDGRMRLRRYSYEGHPLRPQLNHTLGYLGLEPASVKPAGVKLYPQTTTPFSFIRKEVIAMMGEIEARENKPFGRAFLERKLTEFFLYTGWLIKRGAIDQFYDFSLPECPAIWSHQASAVDVLGAVGWADDAWQPFFTVHRATFPKMTDVAAQEALAQFWKRRKLFDTRKEAREFIAKQRR